MIGDPFESARIAAKAGETRPFEALATESVDYIETAMTAASDIISAMAKTLSAISGTSYQQALGSVLFNLGVRLGLSGLTTQDGDDSDDDEYGDDEGFTKQTYEKPQVKTPQTYYGTTILPLGKKAEESAESTLLSATEFFKKINDLIKSADLDVRSPSPPVLYNWTHRERHTGKGEEEY